MGIILFIFGLYKAHKVAHIDLKESLKPLIPIFIIGTISFLILKILSNIFEFDNTIVFIFIKVFILLFFYLSMLFMYYKEKTIDLIRFKEI